LAVGQFSSDSSCIDYRSFVYHIGPDISAARYEEIKNKLKNLGRAEDERMGVIYVRGPWGFFVIPHFGFSTLRISFFHDTSGSEQIEMMKAISAIFENK